MSSSSRPLSSEYDLYSPLPRGTPKTQLVSEAAVDALLVKLQADEPITAPERRQLAGIVQSFAHIVELVAAGQTARIATLLGI